MAVLFNYLNFFFSVSEWYKLVHFDLYFELELICSRGTTILSKNNCGILCVNAIYCKINVIETTSGQ